MAGTTKQPAGYGRIAVVDDLIPRTSDYHGLDVVTEAILVSGMDATNGGYKQVTLTANRIVGAPLNGIKGSIFELSVIEGGAGGFTLTWSNAIFKGITWTETGNVTAARSSIVLRFDGTNWNQSGAQAPYHA